MQSPRLYSNCTNLCDFCTSLTSSPASRVPQADVQGTLKQIGDEFGTVMSGSYSYVTPEGNTVKITWVADENGFRAEGDAIPVAPTV